MKVTGWTHWDNPNYIDIHKENMELRVRATKNITKLPNIKEVREHKYTKEELDEIINKHTKEFDAALDTEEIHAANQLESDIYDVVVQDVRNHGYHFTGDDHQNSDYGTPIIDDKYIFCASQRTWGGIIAAAFPDEIDNSDGYGYIKWAWTIPEGEEDKVKIPSEF